MSTFLWHVTKFGYFLLWMVAIAWIHHKIGKKKKKKKKKKKPMVLIYAYDDKWT
jgi:hypothetical protein